MLLVDSHCHLSGLDYSKTPLADVLQQAAQESVGFCLSVATTLSDFYKMQTLLAPYRQQVALSCGVHPLNLEDEGFDAEALANLAQDDWVIGIGETGLDYYYVQDNKAEQQAAFAEHIRLSNRLGKPIIVHTRSAREDTLAILKAEQIQAGVLHCFTEDLATAKAVLDLGMYISFSGIITFTNAEALREVARYVPLERMLIETDSPYLAPVPYRGKPNQPAYVREVAEYLSMIKNVPLTEFAKQTTGNFSQLFNVTL